MKKKILFDLQGIQGLNSNRGIGKYINSFLYNLIQVHDNKFSFIFFMNAQYYQTITEYKLKYNNYLSNIDFVLFTPIPNSKNLNEFTREYLIYQSNPDFVVICDPFIGENTNDVNFFLTINKYFNVRTLSFCYDLIPLKFRNYYFSSKKKFLSYLERTKFLNLSDAILTISDNVKNDIVKFLKIDNDSVFNIGFSSSSEIEKLSIKYDKKFLDKFELSGHFILCAGGADFRKNIINLIKGYLKLEKKLKDKFNLVIVGQGHENFIDDYINLINGIDKHALRYIKFIPYQSDITFNKLFNYCSIFVFPSFEEGGGLPLLEAINLNKTVIASNINAFNNFLTEQFLFNPFDINDIFHKIHYAIDFHLRNENQEYFVPSENSWESVSNKFISCLTKLNPINKKLIHNGINGYLSLIRKNFPKSNKSDVSDLITNNFNSTGTQRLYIDISELFFRDAKTGIQRVVNNILDNLLSIDQQNFDIIPVFSTVDSLDYYEANINSNDFIPITPGPDDIFLGLDLQHHVILSKEKYFDFLYSRGVRIFFVVYDLIPIKYPQFWPKEHKVSEIHKRWLHVICKYRNLLAISDSVKHDLLSYFKKYDITVKVKTFKMGSDIRIKNNLIGSHNLNYDHFDKLKNKINFLMVGTIEPRKGHIDVLNAINLLFNSKEYKNKISLTIIGKIGWLTDDILEFIKNHNQYNKNLFLFTEAEDDFLTYSYANANCLISASYDEGFGLPLIEAARFNLPIFARDIPIFREVGNNHIFYSSFKSAKTTSIDLIKWIHLFDVGNLPSSSQIKTYDWNQSARSLIKSLNIFF